MKAEPTILPVDRVTTAPQPLSPEEIERLTASFWQGEEPGSPYELAAFVQFVSAEAHARSLERIEQLERERDEARLVARSWEDQGIRDRCQRDAAL